MPLRFAVTVSMVLLGGLLFFLPGRDGRAPLGPGELEANAVTAETVDVSPDVPVDSALDELAAGRFWHAALMLRAQGKADGTPTDVLTLARAEAGWGNWSAVLDLLERATWLGEVGEGEGHLLLGQALEREDRWAEAAGAFDAYARAASPPPDAVAAILTRRATALWHADDRAGAVEALERIEGVPYLRSWLAADLTLEAAAAGDVGAVGALLPHVTDDAALDAVWRADADALLAAGDHAHAAERFGELRADAARAGRRERAAAAGLEVARILRADGDTAAARPLFDEALQEGAGAVRSAAAAALVDLGGGDAEAHVFLAGILNRAGDGRRALLAYDRAARAVAQVGGALDDDVRLARARLMGTVRDRQGEALEEFRALRETVTDRDLAARNLEAWAQMRGRQGLEAQVRTLRGWLVDEYPESPGAAEIVFMRGFDADTGGRPNEALRHYEAVAGAARTHARAGQARMRSGQIHLGLGDLEEAARTFEAYLEDFPTGRRWEEAAYWAGRVRLQLGDTAVGERHLRRLSGEPLSYYAVVAAELLDEDPLVVDVPEGEPPIEPTWLSDGLARFDHLVDAGLTRGADAEIERLIERTSGSRAHTLALAEGLIARGRTIEGINLGWALQADGHAWDRHLLRVVFPFPHRELVRREAEEWGVDPIMLAALIRQESAFKADIVSRAGAIGLMQVMPPTGAQLARTHGPSPFTPSTLRAPEVNLHLGSAFFVEMSRRYDDDLPLVLSAYNAGPTRANRWRSFPEASDAPRFTERIPFEETRGYVKNIRRNLGLYQMLYGEE